LTWREEEAAEEACSPTGGGRDVDAIDVRARAATASRSSSPVGDKEARLPAFLMGSREGGIMDVLLYHRGAAGFGNEIFIVRLRLASLLLQNNH
jgi:hypothetical protein